MSLDSCNGLEDHMKVIWYFLILNSMPIIDIILGIFIIYLWMQINVLKKTLIELGKIVDQNRNEAGVVFDSHLETIEEIESSSDENGEDLEDY